MATPTILVPQFSGTYAAGTIPNAALVNSSVTVTAGTGLSGGGSVALGASVSLSLPNVGPGAGTIGGAGSAVQSITLDAQGRVTAAASTSLFYQTIKNSAGTAQTQRANLKFGSDFTTTDTAPDSVIALASNSVTVTAGTGLSGGGAVALGSSVTLSLPNVGPGAGTIGGSPNAIQSITLDAQGRVTAAATVSLSGMLTGTLTSGRIPVANGTNSLTDSSLTWSGSTLDSTLATVVLGGTMTTLQWAAGTSKTINVATSAADTAGTALNVNAGAGGVASATGAGTGGNWTAAAGQGGNGSGALGGGTGGIGQLSGGAGGQGTASAAGGGGGAASVRGGAAGLNNGAGGGTAGTASIRGGNGAAPSGSNNTGANGGLTQVLGAVPGDGTATAAGGIGGQIQITGQAGGLDGGAGAGAGSSILITAGIGRAGASSATTGNTGSSAGAITISSAQSGAGGAGTTNGNGGQGGTSNAWSWVANKGGDGGAGAGSGVGGAGGNGAAWTISAGAGGQGGTGATPGASGVGGALTLQSGNGGLVQGSNGGASAGAVVIDTGTTSGSAALATITIGGSNAGNVNIGRSGQLVLFPGGVLRAATPGTGVAAVAFQIGFNNGAAGSGATAGTTGGSLTLQSGQGGAATTTAGGTAATGGGTILAGGQGGTGAASTNGPGAGGNVSINGGAAGTVTSGFSGANGGNVTILGGALSGTGTNGSVNIATSQTSTLTIGGTSLTTGPTFNTATGTTYTWQINSSNVATLNISGSSAIFQFLATNNGVVNVGTAATDVAGKNFTINSGNAGTASASNGQAGGLLNGTAGSGAAATATRTAGTGGIAQWVGGTGGQGNSTNPGGVGGQNSVVGGTGGAGTASALSGSGGLMLISGGTAGASGGAGQGNGGGVTIRGGAGATNGTINLGDANTLGITLSVNTTLLDTKQFLASYNGNNGLTYGVAGAAWASISNNNSSSSSVMQSPPGYETLGIGWSYLPGVVANAGQMSRSGSTVTVTTATNHGFSSGINIDLYPGEANFPGGIKGPITVTGLNTFTYTEAGTATTSVSGQDIFDDTGLGQTVKVQQTTRIQPGGKFSVYGQDSGMAFPEVVWHRTSYPNNGPYSEWFKFSAGLPLNTNFPNNNQLSTGVALVTPNAAGNGIGTWLSLAPQQWGFSDGVMGMYSVNTPFPTTGGFISIWGCLIFDSGVYGRFSAMGAGLGIKNGTWYDSFTNRINGQNIGLGDVATPIWADVNQSAASGYDWYSDQGNTIQPVGLHLLGGGARFEQLPSPTLLTGVATGGSGTSRTYLVVAVDRNGGVTGSTSVTVSGGATLSNTVFDTLTWQQEAGAAWYDIYLTTINQAGYLGSVQASVQGGVFLPNTTLSFKNTGQARYTIANGAPSNNTMVNPTMLTGSWGGQTGSSQVITNGFVKLNGSTTVTLTFATAHFLKVGDTIVISGLSNTTQFANGTYTVATIVSPTIITYTDSVNNASGSTQTTTGTFAVTKSYAVYGVDFDGHVTTAASASANFANGPGLGNYINVAWTPVAGATKYLVCRDDSTHPIIIQAQQGVQQAGGTGVTFAKSGTSTVTVTTTNGHGLYVGDSFTVSSLGNTTNFSNGTFTVVSVSNSTVFTYTDATGGTFTGSTTGNFSGPFVTTASVADYGYSQRTIASVSRNTTADVQMDGRLKLQPPSGNNSATLTASDSAGNIHYGIDAYGFQSLGSVVEIRENWLMGQTLSASQTNAVFTGGVWKYTSSANATGFTNTSGFATGSPLGSGISVGSGTASGNFTLVTSVASIFTAAQLNNLYAIAEFPAVLSAVGANNYTARVGFSANNLSSAHPGGYYFSKASTDTNWQCVCDDGTTTNSSDSGVAPVAGTVQILRIEYYGSGTVFGQRTVVFKINGAIVKTLTTNVYNGGVVFFQIYATATNTISQQSIGVGPVLMQYNMVASNPVV
jgi:hypothetical protein